MSIGIIEAVLSAADREIVGRIRIQKVFYLLQQLGLGDEFEFSYHHYGPYSHSLSHELMINSIFSESFDEVQKVTSFGTRYSVYQLSGAESVKQESVGELIFSDVEKYIATMKDTTSVVIELAATIHWLKEKEKISDWKSELKNRKSSKATPENIASALKLLNDIKL